MTITLEDLKRDNLHSTQNKRKYNCRMNFKRFTKKRNKDKENKDNNINIKTALIKNEVIGDDIDEYSDINLMRTCNKFKILKNSSKTKIYKTNDKKLDNYDYERDQTFCSLTDLEDVVNEDKKRSKFFFYKNKSLNDYNKCYEKKSKRLKWFRLRRKKKESVEDKNLKYLNESVCSNYKDLNSKNQLDNSSQYTKKCVLNTINGIKGVSTWIF
ncbi:conserved Plasmodium protein, unknown function [Plasmodium relictum]|uniref:Uncharacterized protein n=1 Tax=Plasmodium relictum TaxID=85471 RepID=A0A1J1HB21_PLARL|nr:conserved Plasmodium protein, unknown function [Plasmodium relictum]CRH02603.1 conserved Plasmodium protein, unknown function [Plasmodium relictum]